MGCKGSKTEDQSKYETKAYPNWPEDCKSRLRQFMTKEVWDKYQGTKDSFGNTLGMCINSGTANFDSENGVYASSAETYTVFSDLLDKIVEDYHKFPHDQKHVSNMDASEIAKLPNLDPDNKFIVSTRIRVARNLSAYPFGPCMSSANRMEIEKTMSETLASFTGDLAGKYYSLAKMTKEEQQKLIDDHFLFKEGDRFLEAAGLNRDWPNGRGIFHNESKTFLCWINEEDELRIISMQQGSNISEVFERLCRGAKLLEEKAQFAHSERLGYLTCCPTNLGTGMRASVHVRVPLLAEDKAKFDEIADKYQVQIRGTAGEHSASVGGVYDISNRRRLGRSEADLVKDMYDGVKAMIEAEKELQKKAKK